MQLENLTSPDVGALDRDGVACLLPLGAVEQHGPHMPLGTDSMICHAICKEAAARLPGRVLVLPPPWYGLSPHHMRFAGSITLRAETLMALAGDIVDSLVNHGFRRIVLVNGHGGNASLAGLLAATLGHRHHGKARVAALTYFQLAAEAINDIRESGPGGAGHACEIETSLIQHLFPELVRNEAATATYPTTGTPYLTTDLTAGGPVASYMDFSELSSTGVLGDPTLASGEKGARLFDACSGALADFVADFLKWPAEPEGGRR